MKLAAWIALALTAAPLLSGQAGTRLNPFPQQPQPPVQAPPPQQTPAPVQPAPAQGGGSAAQPAPGPQSR